MVLEYNHQVSQIRVRFLGRFKNINDTVKRRLDFNDRFGICLNKNFNSLVVENLGGGGSLLREILSKFYCQGKRASAW